ncbi:MAG TPA: FtsX-like permease family protein, partial [Cyclobacteriaceae bacterium]|nr:FtsX-like permease family protein [Cyclobacteriaceae bacterium]
IPFIQGDPATALEHPNTMVITEKCAQQFFPGEDPVGKTLIKDNQTLYKVTGVVRDMPDNSHFHYRMFLSLEGLDESKSTNWLGGAYNTYLLLQPGISPETFEEKLQVVVGKYILPNAQLVLGSSFTDTFNTSGDSLILRATPLSDIHLRSHLQNELESNGDIAYVYLFGAIAVFTLVVACINFINLTTARSARRAREVGIRKVLGSGRLNLALQFICESTILCILAFVLSLGLTQMLLPLFNSVTGLDLEIPFGNVSLGFQLFGAVMVVGIISGLYPGVMLSSYQPAQVLKGKTVRNGSSFFMSSLVVFQFTLSIFLITATLALHEQMKFMQEKKLGFDKEQVIVMRDVKNLGNRLSAIKEVMTDNRMVKTGTVSSFFPGPGSTRSTPLMWHFGSTPLPENAINAEKWLVDYDYIPTLGIEIIEGRNFSRDYPSDSNAVIFNESAIARFRFEGSPVGRKVSLFREKADGSLDLSRLETWNIIGVAKDFNFESLRENVQPLGLFFGSSHGALAFRYESENTQEVIHALEAKWKGLAPGEPFNYTFLDQNFESLYKVEARVSKLFATFAGLAIIIACLGLFALTAYTAEQRTREIGIRKVLGASVQSIVLLLTRDFSRWIFAGFVLATPLAIYGIQWYLQDYAYRTSIGWWIYATAGAITFALALLTMGYQSVMSGRTNPVQALKSE